MMLQEGMLQFEFSEDALSVFKFDEQNAQKPTFHGLSHCMKAVDMIVEYDHYYVFIEIKNPTEQARYDSPQDNNELVLNLVTKFRDSFLYRWSEQKLDKPVRYQCLIEMDNALTHHVMKQLKIKLPMTNLPVMWHQQLAEFCGVFSSQSLE